MKPLNILLVQSSSRRAESVTRRLATEIAQSLAVQAPGAATVVRDVAEGMPFVDEAWIAAAFTPPERRAADQAAHLSYSDMLVRELASADVIVIGAPMYNFGMPASLKAWIDQIARARLTFQYTERGPVGLLVGKKAILVVATGGSAVGGPADHLTGHLKQALAFIGIKDVAVVAADQLAANADSGLARAAADVERAIAFAGARSAAA
ncbi:MAG: NAD(P)H-dependent oxidoreductase [Parvularculaceae bacterium]|nr:NAD(P)H-dependent oxidoreductase [Parvularculaceae bacterium]